MGVLAVQLSSFSIESALTGSAQAHTDRFPAHLLESGHPRDFSSDLLSRSLQTFLESNKMAAPPINSQTVLSLSALGVPPEQISFRCVSLLITATCPLEMLSPAVCAVCGPLSMHVYYQRHRCQCVTAAHRCFSKPQMIRNGLNAGQSHKMCVQEHHNGQ